MLQTCPRPAFIKPCGIRRVLTRVRTAEAKETGGNYEGKIQFVVVTLLHGTKEDTGTVERKRLLHV